MSDVKSNPDTFSTKLVLLLSASFAVMSGSLVSPALPAIESHFSEVPNVSYWTKSIPTLPALSILFASPVIGIIADRIGRKTILLVGMAIYAIAGSSAFVLNSLTAILISRVVLGLAVAAVMVTTMSLTSDYYDGKQRSRIMGWQSACMGISGTVFVAVAGVLADLGWRWPFLLHLIFLLLFPIAIRSIYEPERSSPQKPEEPTKDNSLPIRLLILVYATAILKQIATLIVFLQVPFYVKEILGNDGTRSGFALAGRTLSSSIAAAFYSKLKQNVSFIRLAAIGFSFAGIGFGTIALTNGYFALIGGLVLAGVGTGIVNPNANVWVSRKTPERLYGRAIGGLTTSFYVGQLASTFISESLVGQFGLNSTFGYVGIAFLALGAIFLTLKRQIAAMVSPAS